jgi:hypothetical protein
MTGHCRISEQANEYGLGVQRVTFVWASTLLLLARP